MSAMDHADLKGRLAGARHTATGQDLELIGEPADMPGYWLWMCGRVAVLIPKLREDAPRTIRRRYLDRIRANATGRCPRCDTVHTDPAASFEHEAGCPLTQSIDNWLVA